ncbi:hypothetical protein HDU86_003670 [Geranomyces michiganensis]|nr:hypothetical protein HDU86_003670 [Geranomyces michiganensis]
MTVAATAIPTVLPQGVKTAGCDNAAFVKLPEEAGDHVLSNGETYPSVGHSFLASLGFEDAKRATLQGPILLKGSELKLVDLPGHEGAVAVAYEFIGKQTKLFDDEVEFDGFWKGVFQFSKFRWIVTELVPSTEEQYNAAVEQSAAAVAAIAEDDGEKLLEQATVAIKAGNNAEAIALLTRALVKCEIPEEVENDDDPFAVLRARVLAARTQAAFNLKAYREAIRDGEMVERIYGQPMQALNELEQDHLGAYFQAVCWAAQAHHALGHMVEANAAYMSIMILKMIGDQNDEHENEGVEAPTAPVAADIAAELIKVAEAGLAAEEEAGPHMQTIYRLKMTLLGVEPPVWRTLDVAGSTTLGDLREFITMAFGWCGAPNAHEFEVYDHGLVRFTTIPEDFEEEDEEGNEKTPEEIERFEVCEDEDTTPISMVVERAGDSFTYLYEKGAWVHQIVVEEVRQEEVKEDACCDHDHDGEDGDEEHEHEHSGPEYPKLIAGARACPPDEVGGPAGYVEFLKAASGEPTKRWADRVAALTWAADNVGFSNYALDSWGGKQGFEAMLSAEEIEEIGDEELRAEHEAKLKEPKDLAKGGWDAESFDIEEANRSLSTIAAMIENGDDEDEEFGSDDDDEEEIDL